MSRFADCDDDRPAFWIESAVRRSVASKKGQRVLQDLRAALDSLPAKRLLEGAVCENGEVCAMGALAVYRYSHDHGFDRGAVIEMLDRWGYETDEETVALGVRLGVSESLAREIAWVNDGPGNANSLWSPETRWQIVSEWVDCHLAAAGG